MWKSVGRAPLCEFYPGICLTTEEKAWKNLSQGKKNLRVQYTYYQKNTHERERERERERESIIQFFFLYGSVVCFKCIS
jgi:hypothetical protein